MRWMKDYISIYGRCDWRAPGSAVMREKHTVRICISAKEKSRDAFLSRLFGMGMIEKLNYI
jgi:hypothetical protein